MRDRRDGGTAVCVEADECEDVDGVGDDDREFCFSSEDEEEWAKEVGLGEGGSGACEVARYWVWRVLSAVSMYYGMRAGQ